LACVLVAQVSAEERATHPFLGLTSIIRTETAPRPVRMHIVLVDLSAPGLRIRVTPQAGARETIREPTVVFARREGAQAAINAHFFLPFPSADAESWLVGFGASDGRVYSAFETPEQSFAIVPNAPAVNVDPGNHASIVHRDPAGADGRVVRERARVWNAVAGSAQIVTEGRTTIPAYTDARHAGAPLTAGGPGNYSNEKSWYDAVTSRTAIGLSRDGRTLTLFAVDSRDGSQGMRVGEVADLLVSDYHVWNALNLDGGGSTSMALEDPLTHVVSLVTETSDGAPGRAVGSSLAVFARPRP
jgi:hypothetical protein